MNVYCIDGEGSLYQLVKSVYPECQVFRGGKLSRQFLSGFDIVFLDASLDQDKVTSLLNLKLSSLFLVVREYSGIDVLLPNIISSPLRLVLLKDLRERRISLEEISVSRKNQFTVSDDLKIKKVMPDLAWDIINELSHEHPSTLKWEELFLEWASKVSNAERLSLFIERESDFRLKASIGDAEAELKGMCFAAGEELKKTFRSGQRIFYHDIASEGDYSNLHRVMESLLAVAALSFELNGERAMIFLSGSKDGSVCERGILESILWIADIFAARKELAENSLIIDDQATTEQSEKSDAKIEIRDLLKRLSLRTSNDFRNALVSIKTFTQLMPKRYKDANFRNDFYAVLSSEINRLESLVNELSFFSDNHELNLKNGNLYEIFLQSADALEKNFTDISFNIIGDKNISAHFDKELLSIAFREIFKNAVQAMSGKGEVTVTFNLKSTGRMGDFLNIKVQDTGSGIDSEYKDSLTEPFISSRPNGLGLGLVMVKEIIDLHSGELQINNLPDKGTEVLIILPCKHPISPEQLKEYLSGKN